MIIVAMDERARARLIALIDKLEQAPRWKRRRDATASKTARHAPIINSTIISLEFILPFVRAQFGASIRQMRERASEREKEREAYACPAKLVMLRNTSVMPPLVWEISSH